MPSDARTDSGQANAQHTEGVELNLRAQAIDCSRQQHRSWEYYESRPRLPVFEKRRMPEKPNVTLPGKVEKIIPSPSTDLPEKAQISVEGADDLYREIRIENALMDEHGNEAKLKEDDAVEVTVEADEDATIRASENLNLTRICARSNVDYRLIETQGSHSNCFAIFS